MGGEEVHVYNLSCVKLSVNLRYEMVVVVQSRCGMLQYSPLQQW